MGRTLIAKLIPVTLILCVVSAKAAFAQSSPKASTDWVVDELVSTPDFGIVYIADGAGDGTVLNGAPAESVRKIVSLRDNAIPC